MLYVRESWEIYAITPNYESRFGDSLYRWCLVW
jgi:hypothetical protein